MTDHGFRVSGFGGGESMTESEYVDVEDYEDWVSRVECWEGYDESEDWVSRVGEETMSPNRSDTRHGPSRVRESRTTAYD